MIPTTRAAGLLAGVALSALVLPAWVAGALALALAAAVAADAWSVRAAPPVGRELPEVVSRGSEVRVVVRSGAFDSRSVLLRQATVSGIELEAASGVGELQARLVARRRGRHHLPGVASASLGPLRLARVHHPPGEAAELRVYPDFVGARRLILRLRQSLAGLAGGLARGPLGLGTEFESVRDYTPDDDIRTLNWRASARLERPMSNQYRVDRDRDVICLIDCGRLTAASLGGSTVLDVAMDAATVVALAADELGDRFGAIAFDDGLRQALAPRHRGGRASVEALFDLQSRPVDSDFEAAFVRVGRSRRSLVFVHTDLIDEAAARSLLGGVGMLVRRHAVVIASAGDPELEALAAGAGGPARTLAALDVLAARRRAALRLRGAGALVLEASPDRLAERCLDAYVRAKLRASL